MQHILKYFWDNIEVCNTSFRNNPKLLIQAKKRSLIVIGVALKLLGDESIKPDIQIRRTIDKEVALINKAQGFFMPAWIKKDNQFKGIDYSKFKPFGLYAANESLSGYFKAITWLQTIPFRSNFDNEFLAILMLGDFLKFDHRYIGKQEFIKQAEQVEKLEKILSVYDRLFGSGYGADLRTAGIISEYKDYAGIKIFFGPENFLHSTFSYENGKLALKDFDKNTENKPIRFSIFQPYSTPYNSLFETTATVRSTDNYLPSGLDLASALGSELADQIIIEKNVTTGKTILNAIKNSKITCSDNNIYNDYMVCIEELAKKPEIEAPFFMKNILWMKKNIQTILAASISLCGTREIQTKHNFTFMAEHSSYSGFIEPTPTFYSKLADLSIKTRDLFRESGIFEDNINRNEIADDLKTFSQQLKVEETRIPYAYYKQRLPLIISSWNFIDLLPDLKERKFNKDNPHILNEIADKIANDPLFYQANKQSIDKVTYYPEQAYEELFVTCLKLEALSQKQLRQKEFSMEDNYFIRNYGKKLASIMFYKGTSRNHAVRDSQRISVVGYNQSKKIYKYIAIGHPISLYVFYPSKDKNILCKGAVMSCYEFASRRTINNEKWREILDESLGENGSWIYNTNFYKVEQ
jgi:hypothetical protein